MIDKAVWALCAFLIIGAVSLGVSQNQEEHHSDGSLSGHSARVQGVADAIDGWNQKMERQTDEWRAMN